jgi:hypothetical protein
MPPGVVAGPVGVPVEPGGHVVGVLQADGEVPGVPGAPGTPCVPGVSVGPHTGGGVVQPGAPAGDCWTPGTAFSCPHGPYGETSSGPWLVSVDGVVFEVLGAGAGAGVVSGCGVAGGDGGVVCAGGAGVVVVPAGG